MLMHVCNLHLLYYIVIETLLSIVVFQRKMSVDMTLACASKLYIKQYVNRDFDLENIS